MATILICNLYTFSNIFVSLLHKKYSGLCNKVNVVPEYSGWRSRGMILVTQEQGSLRAALAGTETNVTILLCYLRKYNKQKLITLLIMTCVLGYTVEKNHIMISLSMRNGWFLKTLPIFPVKQWGNLQCIFCMFFFLNQDSNFDQFLKLTMDWNVVKYGYPSLPLLWTSWHYHLSAKTENWKNLVFKTIGIMLEGHFIFF